MLENPLWYKDAIFYELYVRAFKDSNGDGHGDLTGLIQKLNYLKELGVDCIWLLPIYPSPLKDDGYDIADFYSVHPDYGTLDDFKALIEAAHARDIRVVIDLVLNHTSDQHPWFKAARADRTNPYRQYYVWSDTDAKYQEARVIFIDSEDSNWAWDEVSGQYYWHRFYASQPDLNYDNPQVQEEMLRVVEFWLKLGVDGFRVDAVPYLFEREGTNCENLPETHQYLKKLRQFVDTHYPDRVLLCEANQLPVEVRDYFGEGDEMHMAFHFPLMPRAFMALRNGDAKPLIDVLDRTPPIPDNCQWSLFLRNHDELSLEMVSEEQRQWMWREYAPEPRMRINLGIRRRLAPLLDNDQRKLELAYSLLLTLPGSPVIYYGDEIGMGDNIGLPDRNGVRTPMQWEAEPAAGFSSAPPDKFYLPVIDDAEYGPATRSVRAQKGDPESLFSCIKRMISIRKQHPAFGRGRFAWAERDHPGVLAYWRTCEDERLLIVHNLTPHSQEASISLTQGEDRALRSLLSETLRVVPKDGKLSLNLAPYAYHWFRA